MFAYVAEIDAWLNRQPGDGSQPRAVSAISHPSARTGRLRRIVVLTIPTVLVVGLVLAVAVRFPFGSKPGSVERIKISRAKVQALDGSGRQMWEYSFAQPARITSEADARDMERRARFVDLDGDGSAEVIVTARLETEGDPGRLSRSVVHCFKASGQLLWKYDPDLNLSFAGRSFGGPWHINDVLAVSEGNRQTIWVVVAHHTWWPSLVVKLDATGKAETRFVNSGTVEVLNLLRTPESSYVLAGGFNNELDGGVMAVLPADKPAGSSPQKPGSPYQCDVCPPGEPILYFVFPRSEVNRSLINANNPVEQILITQRSVDVSTGEAPNGVRAFYGFSLDPEMRLLSTAFSDASYWRQHQLLEREGKLNHPAKECPERIRLPQVRVWTPKTGWEEASFATGSRTANQDGNR